MCVIRTVGLMKQYGQLRAVHNINFKIEKGFIYGLVGPNGAGKTTCLKLLTGSTEATAGQIQMFGQDFTPNSKNIKKEIGYVPETDVHFPYFKAEEQLYYIARLYGLNSHETRARTDELFQKFELTSFRSAYINSYSKGMKKKLSLMCAIIHSPRILILDEVFDGLDFVSLRQIVDMLKIYVEHGGTIIMSSHNLKMIESLCKKIIILHKGECIFDGYKKNLHALMKRDVTNKAFNGLETIFMDIVESRPDSELPEWIRII